MKILWTIMADQGNLPETGSFFMVGMPGPELDSSTEQLVRELAINNFVIFRRNFINPGQLQRLCHDLAAVCQENDLPFPLIAIDQEGGTVARLTEPFSVFPDARVMAEDGDQALIAYGRICAKELLGVGINMNLAPVLDVCPQGQGYFMERRVLGEDPRQVAERGMLIIREMQDRGLVACAKHFPGLGMARLDPHQQLPRVSSSRDEMAGHLEPFVRVMEDGGLALMTSHTIYEDLDPRWPATLSGQILTGLLRDKLGYDGLLLTDDLEMGAIENEMTAARAATLSFQAGADLLLICEEHEKVREAHGVMVEARTQGVFGTKRLLESARRLAGVRSFISKKAALA